MCPTGGRFGFAAAARTAQVVHSGAVAKDLQASEYQGSGGLANAMNAAAGIAPVSRATGAVAVPLEST